MNIKNLIFRIVAFFLIINAQLVYTNPSQDDNKKSQSAVEQNQNEHSQTDDQYDQEIWKFIEETFQSVVDQTQKIEFCLQQVEQIINAGKINFNDKKVSKSELLREIKDIKQIINTLYQFYSNTKQLSKDEAMIKGACFNIAFTDYLLPVFKNDITKINANDFDQIVIKRYKELLDNLSSIDQLLPMIEENEANLKLLIDAGENIGLTTFNKIYNYLDRTPLPFYGKSTFATMYDVAFWGGATALLYGVCIYSISKKSSIYGTWKETKEVDPVTTWPSTDGKTRYTCWTVEDLPFKSFFGDVYETSRLKQNIDAKEITEIRKNFGLFSYIDETYTTYCDNKFITGTLGLLAASTMPSLKELYKDFKKKINQTINYYAKGDASIAKNSADFTKVYFKDMIGGEHLEKIARELTDYLKNPTRYERAGISPATGFLCVGPSQTGKSFFAKALKTMVDEAFENSNNKVKFAIITPDDIKYFGGFTDIFYWARKNAPIILFIDEIDMYGTRRDKDAKNTQDLLTSMNGVETDPSKKVIVIAATNKPEELDFALKQKGRLGNIITFELPTYECRKQYLEKQLDKKNIALHPDMIDSIAQETDGQTYNMIDDIIRQALQLATYQTRPVNEVDFEITLDREIRKIKPNVTISAQEKELIAIYQAGQAAARHVLSTNQQIVKITIDTVDKPIKSKEGFGIINENKGAVHENHELLPQSHSKQTRLGFVFTISKINNQELLNDEEQEKELIALVSGLAALELIKGKTFNEFGKEDRAKVLDMLEKKFSQGTPITDAIRQQAIAAKDALYLKAKNVLKNHTQFIKTIADQLCKTHTINKKEWAQLVANYKI
ncbi:MAG: AAA family ATPase [Candidatus Dependentiae bacterium]|nr:AAA family ATPase [Candidatus Dependentiae bacterium]